MTDPISVPVNILPTDYATPQIDLMHLVVEYTLKYPEEGFRFEQSEDHQSRFNFHFYPTEGDARVTIPPRFLKEWSLDLFREGLYHHTGWKDWTVIGSLNKGFLGAFVIILERNLQ